MKLKGKPLADAAKAAITDRHKVERERAEKDVARKINELLDRAKHEAHHIDEHQKALTAALERKEKLLDRVRRIKEGDETAMNDPKEDEPQVIYPSPTWLHSRVGHIRFGKNLPY